MNILKNKDKSALSLPKSTFVCGYEIKKMPISSYLKAMETLAAFPNDFMETCFPGKNPSEVLDGLTKINKDSFSELCAGLFLIAPKYIVHVVADLTGIEPEKLLNDPNIGIDGLIGIVNAFIEVNKLGESLSGATALKAKLSGLISI